MRKVLLLLLSVMVSAAAWCQREQKVQVTETMQVPGHMSMDRARAELMEKAMLRGMEQAFGTRVAVERRGTSETRNGGASKETYASGSSESLAGEWLRTDKADFTTDGEWLTLHLSGVVREFPDGRNTPKVRCMRNSKESRLHETNFVDSEKMWLYFRSELPGYVSIYLLDENRKANIIVPYSGDSNLYRVEANKDYVFVDDQDKNNISYNSIILNAPGRLVVNHVYVMFSPHAFGSISTNPGRRDDKTGNDLPRNCSDREFLNWLSHRRVADRDVSVVDFPIFIDAK